ncbi:MAG TPA: hypothetical protein VKS43_05445 [Burkholderiales bacterium]|nr:hypothetical protein [Burkholderiales bacterium]
MAAPWAMELSATVAVPAFRQSAPTASRDSPIGLRRAASSRAGSSISLDPALLLSLALLFQALEFDHSKRHPDASRVQLAGRMIENIYQISLGGGEFRQNWKVQRFLVHGLRDMWKVSRSTITGTN